MALVDRLLRPFAALRLLVALLLVVPGIAQAVTGDCPHRMSVAAPVEAQADCHQATKRLHSTPQPSDDHGKPAKCCTAGTHCALALATLDNAAMLQPVALHAPRQPPLPVRLPTRALLPNDRPPRA